MADGKDPAVEKGVKDLEEEITCAICHEHYSEPKLLPCCHYYCKQCLYQLTLKTGSDKSLSCPECRKDITLPEGGLDNLPTAFFVNRMKEVHSKLELAHGKVEAKCEMCSEDEASAFCQQCAKFMCADCAKSHLKMKKAYPGHKVSPLAEKEEGVEGAKDAIVQVPLCRMHKQPQHVYCYDCKSLVCHDCTTTVHCDHRYKVVKCAAPEIRQELVQQLNPLRKRHSVMLHATNDLQTTVSEVEDQGRCITEQIESSFKELYKIISDHKQELLAETATMVEQKCKHLSEQGKDLSIACAAVESVIDYTEYCVEHSADDKIVCMHTEIQSRIDAEIEKQEKRDLEPVEEADLEVVVSLAEDLKQLCQIKAKLTLLAVDCTATGEGLKTAEVNKQSQVDVLMYGRPRRRLCAAYLKSQANDSITECQVELIEKNKYCIQYTPTVRGRHELIVTVNRQEIAGSPFPVFVSIHPSLLGKPVQVLTGLEDPGDVAVTASGQIIVAHTELTIYERNGKYLRKLENLRYNKEYYVAIDKTGGDVYITDGNKVAKLGPDFELVKNFSGRRYLVHRRMAVVGNEVMVSEHNSTVVVVYTKNLKYVRRIDGQGQFVSIRGISSDEKMNLYISDYDRGCVHVFSNGGGFLYSFGQDSVKCLVHPIGVCVAGQYVYVGDGGGHCVSVFTTKGEYVTSFGQYGNDKGDFCAPRGVCVDKDGFVYVCDSANERVQIF